MYSLFSMFIYIGNSRLSIANWEILQKKLYNAYGTRKLSKSLNSIFIAFLWFGFTLTEMIILNGNIFKSIAKLMVSIFIRKVAWITLKCFAYRKPPYPSFVQQSWFGSLWLRPAVVLEINYYFQTILKSRYKL